MKIAIFNVQNLFHRDRSLIQKTIGKCVSDWIVEFDTLLTKEKSASNTERLKELSFLLDFDKTYQNLETLNVGSIWPPAGPILAPSRSADLFPFVLHFELILMPLDDN